MIKKMELLSNQLNNFHVKHVTVIAAREERKDTP